MFFLSFDIWIQEKREEKSLWCYSSGWEMGVVVMMKRGERLLYIGVFVICDRWEKGWFFGWFCYAMTMSVGSWEGVVQCTKVSDLVNARLVQPSRVSSTTWFSFSLSKISRPRWTAFRTWTTFRIDSNIQTIAASIFLLSLGIAARFLFLLGQIWCPSFRLLLLFVLSKGRNETEISCYLTAEWIIYRFFFCK